MTNFKNLIAAAAALVGSAAMATGFPAASGEVSMHAPTVQSASVPTRAAAPVVISHNQPSVGEMTAGLAGLSSPSTVDRAAVAAQARRFAPAAGELNVATENGSHAQPTLASHQAEHTGS